MYVKIPANSILLLCTCPRFANLKYHLSEITFQFIRRASCSERLNGHFYFAKTQNSLNLFALNEREKCIVMGLWELPISERFTYCSMIYYRVLIRRVKIHCFSVALLFIYLQRSIISYITSLYSFFCVFVSSFVDI